MGEDDRTASNSSVLDTIDATELYRAPKKCVYMVARNFFLLLLNFSAWPCLGAA